ncbi:MAG: hypothetical protein EXS02_14800 [Planctomycetes bacterium]|nr:hypothetical protein [Planctomycetota bacterium]
MNPVLGRTGSFAVRRALRCGKAAHGGAWRRMAAHGGASRPMAADGAARGELATTKRLAMGNDCR